MKRDMDLIRRIMILCEDGRPNAHIDGFEDSAVRYHKKLIIDVGWAEGAVMPDSTHPTEVPLSVVIRNLTWSGHDFLEPIKSETNWTHVKRMIKDSGRELTIELIKVVARELVGGAGR